MQEHAHWWRPAVKSQLHTQSPIGSIESVAADGMGAVMSAGAAEECTRILAQKSTEEEEILRRDSVSDARVRELRAR